MAETRDRNALKEAFVAQCNHVLQTCEDTDPSAFHYDHEDGTTQCNVLESFRVPLQRLAKKFGIKAKFKTEDVYKDAYEPREGLWKACEMLKFLIPAVENECASDETTVALLRKLHAATDGMLSNTQPRPIPDNPHPGIRTRPEYDDYSVPDELEVSDLLIMQSKKLLHLVAHADSTLFHGSADPKKKKQDLLKKYQTALEVVVGESISVRIFPSYNVFEPRQLTDCCNMVRITLARVQRLLHCDPRRVDYGCSCHCASFSKLGEATLSNSLAVGCHSRYETENFVQVTDTGKRHILNCTDDVFAALTDEAKKSRATDSDANNPRKRKSGIIGVTTICNIHGNNPQGNVSIPYGHDERNSIKPNSMMRAGNYLYHHSSVTKEDSLEICHVLPALATGFYGSAMPKDQVSTYEWVQTSWGWKASQCASVNMFENSLDRTLDKRKMSFEVSCIQLDPGKATRFECGDSAYTFIRLTGEQNCVSAVLQNHPDKQDKVPEKQEPVRSKMRVGCPALFPPESKGFLQNNSDSQPCIMTWIRMSPYDWNMKKHVAMSEANAAEGKKALAKA